MSRSIRRISRLTMPLGAISGDTYHIRSARPKCRVCRIGNLPALPRQIKAPLRKWKSWARLGLRSYTKPAPRQADRTGTSIEPKDNRPHGPVRRDEGGGAWTFTSL